MRERVGQSTTLLKPGQLRSAQFTTDPYPLLTILREQLPVLPGLARQLVLDLALRRRHVGAHRRRQLRDPAAAEVLRTRARRARPRRERAGPHEPGRVRWTACADRSSSRSSAGWWRPGRATSPSTSPPACRSSCSSGRWRSRARPCLTSSRGTSACTAARTGSRRPAATAQPPPRSWSATSTTCWTPGARSRATTWSRPSVRSSSTPARPPARTSWSPSWRPTTRRSTARSANLWFLLLTHPDQLGEVAAERRFVKAAYLEAVRHSTPVLTADRFTTREVERFGRLLPLGALVVCAAGRRQPRPARVPGPR